MKLVFSTTAATGSSGESPASFNDDKGGVTELRWSVFGFARVRSPFVGGYGFFFFGNEGPCSDHGTNTSCASADSSKLNESTPPSTIESCSAGTAGVEPHELTRVEMGTVPRFARRAEPFPLNAGSCSSAQTQMSIVPTLSGVLVDTEGNVVDAEGGRLGTTARISCCER